MEEKNLNEKESLELITRMIAQTKSRFGIADGTVLLQWGLLTVAVAAITMATLIITRQPACQALWALMALGTIFSRRKQKIDDAKPVRTYVDRITANFGKFAANMFWPAAIICLVLELGVLPHIGYHNANSPWLLMFIIALVGMGMYSAMLGIVIEVKSLVAGGAIGVTAGLAVAGAALCQVPVTVYWAYPLFMVCFTCMMVIPGLIMRRQARLEADERA